MQGRFEHGPRALGNRSILADPRQWWMKDVINAKVKYREGFRPFAPSVIAEKFKLPMDISGNPVDHHPLRYMLYVTPIKKNWRKKIAAVNHVDNTARPQIVLSQTNNLYHKLITAFYQQTGIPMVLNTSFNLKGEPIVNSPSDAYNTFMRSGIDILVMGNWWIEK
jgi:carbamoyltransferase